MSSAAPPLQPAITTEPSVLVRIHRAEFVRRLFELDPMMKLVVDDLIRKLNEMTRRLEGGKERY